MQLENKIAVITGGASGLGKATAQAFVKKGAQVVIFDMNETAAQDAVSELGGAASYVLVDVCSETSVTEALDIVLQKHQALHVVVNCAGIGPPAKVLDREGNPLGLDAFKKVVDVNLFGTFNVLRIAAAKMIKNQPINDDNGRGLIINVSSCAGFEGQIGQPAYAASKAGVAGMALPIAREFSRYGIRVNTIAPGLFLTPLSQTLPDNILTALGNSVEYPKRLGSPAEFAHTAVFLAENDYINAETIRLDGAIRMQAR